MYPGQSWEHARDVAASTLAAHGFDPPWLFPTVNELKCKLGYGCSGTGPIQTAGEKAAEVAEQEAKLRAAKATMQEFDANGNPKGPQIWPFGVRKYEKSVWTPKDVDELRAKLPGYKIKGPGSRAICWGQGRLDGPRRRLIEMRRGVYTMEEAAAICDDMEECTHFWMTVGPEYPNVVDWEKGIPYRAEFCRGPMVSILDDTNGHSFVGIKKRHSGAPPPKMIPPIPHPEGPLEAYGRDAGYFKSFRQKQQELKEAKKLDSLQSEANQLIAMEKKDQQEDVKAQLKSLQQRLPYLPPAWLDSSKPRCKKQRAVDRLRHFL